jgi:hypothetical protein
MKYQSNEISFLSKCLCSYLQLGVPEGSAFASESAPDWNYLIHLSYYHEIYPIVYNACQKLNPAPPAAFLKQLEKSCQRNTVANMVFLHEFKHISTLLQAQGIRCVPLKGISLLLSLDKRNYTRAMSDIDILVERKSLEPCLAVLEQDGYVHTSAENERGYWLNDQMHLSLTKNGSYPIYIDVHWALDYPRKYQMLENLWGRTRMLSYADSKNLLLSPEDMVLTTALHQRRFGKLLTLKYVADIIMIAQNNELDSTYLLEEARKSKVQSALYFLLVQVCRYTDDRDLHAVLAGLSIPHWKKNIINCMVARFSFRKTEKYDKIIFALIHLLLFETLREPIQYCLTIPREQFRKFFTLTGRKQISHPT